jgi:branched-subunit amino acid ABC-type transport system permease component
MKKHVLDFLRRGLSACGVGPLVLAVIYLILRQNGMETLTVEQVCTGIFSLSALAFVAGGMNFIYRIERLPLMPAILIHGGVLYLSYLATYLLNNWLEWGMLPILVFTVIFVLGYLVIWVIIYSFIRRNTNKINKLLKEQQQNAK